MKIRSVRFNLLFALSTAFMLLSASWSVAQEEAESSRALELNKTLSDSLSPKGTHEYTIQLDADRFVYTEVNQISVDVVITIKNPDGNAVKTVDGPDRGPETILFDSDDAGLYRLEVKPFKEGAGLYSIELKNIEPVATDPEKRVDQFMFPYDRTDTPGAAVAVVKKDKVIFSKAYGMANLTYDIPFTTETLNNIGSTSKQFTAFAILLLAKQGKLSLDDDIRDYIPELPEFGRKVTLRNLLTHTSGYREFINLLILGGLNLGEGDYINKEEVIEIVQAQPELQNDPGAEWNYNNTGFSLLSTVVERITEQKFPEWMRKKIFEPIGMTHTQVRAHPREVVPNSAMGYLFTKEGGFEEGRDIASSAGAGGIYSTVGDLAKWISNFRKGKVGGEDIIDQMFTRFVLTDGDTTGYGLGLFIDKFKGLERVHHGGADIAHRSMLMYFPEINAGVITQSNHARFQGTIPNQIAEAFFAEHMTVDAGEKDKTEAPSAFNPEDYDPVKFDEFVGRYELEAVPGIILEFTREEDKFFTQATNQPKVEIAPTSDSTFKILIVDASITFHRNAENEVESLTLHQNGDHPAKRLMDEPWKPSAVDLQVYTGRYFSKELETFYTLEVEDSTLVVKHKRMADIKLTPSKIDTFTASFPISNLIINRDEAGEVIGLKVGNGRTRDVKFDRLNK